MWVKIQNQMTTHVTKASPVASKMVNENNSNAPSHNNGSSLNAINAVNLSGTSATPTNSMDFGDNLNSKSEFSSLLCFALFSAFNYSLIFFVADVLFVFNFPFRFSYFFFRLVWVRLVFSYKVIKLSMCTRLSCLTEILSCYICVVLGFFFYIPFAIVITLLGS